MDVDKQLMTRFRAFNIYLLTLVIFFGSILNVHAHPDLFGSEASESSKEIEDASSEGEELLHILNFAFLLNSYPYLVCVISLPANESHSHNVFTTSRLLTSHRIALPPPQLA